MEEECHIHSQLQEMRNIKGVENIFLAQRDGYPIRSAGVWFSPNEIFGVAAAAAAIFAVAHRLYKTLNYALVEGDQVKFLIATVPEDTRYFLSLTTRITVNLGAIFHRIRHCTQNIYPHLQENAQLPPLRNFNEDETRSILNRFDSQNKQQVTPSAPLIPKSLVLSESLVTKLRALLSDFSGLLGGTHTTFISLNGGYPIAPPKELDSITSTLSAFTYALFDTCRKVAWLTKRTRIDQVTIDFGAQHHFIYSAGSGIFSTTLDKNHHRLGFLRLLIPTYTTRIKETLEEAMHTPVRTQTTQPLNRFLEGFLSTFRPQPISG